MPGLGSLDQYLAQRYAQLGLNVEDLEDKGRELLQTRMRPIPQEQIPPATRAFPQITPAQFISGRIEAQTEKRGFWQSVFDAMGAGEYTVANFIRTLVRGGDVGDAATNAWEGFKSAFTGDQEYQTRMFDVLTDLGWKPTQNSASYWGKWAVGLISGFALDPVTYVGFGPAARGLRLGGTLFKEAAEKAGLAIPKAYAQGQVLSKVGRKAYETLAAGYKPNLGIAAGNVARDDMVRLTLNTAAEEMTPDVLGRIASLKDAETIKKILPVMGRDTSDASVDWFLRGGYSDLLDKGGLKFMGMSIPGTTFRQYLTPRASSLHGLLLGNIIQTNAPLLTKAANAIKKTKAWDTIVTNGLGNLFGHFTRYRGISDEVERDWLNRLAEGGAKSRDLLASIAESYRHYGADEIKEIDTLFGKMQIPIRGGKRLTDDQMRFLMRMLPEARQMGLSGDALSNTIRDVVRNEENPLHALAGKRIAEVSDERLEGMIQVAGRIQKLFSDVAGWEEKRGYLKFFDSEYFPKEWKLLEEAGIDTADYANRNPWWFNKAQLNPYGWRDIMGLVASSKGKKLPGMLSDRWEEILTGRLSTSFRHAYQEDVLQEMAGRISKHPEILADLKGVMRDPEFLAQNPKVASMLADLSSLSEVEGLSKSELGSWEEAMRRLSKAKTPDALDTAGLNANEVAKNIANLDQSNIQGLLRRLEHAIETRRNDISILPATEQEGTRRLVDDLERWKQIVTRTLGERALGREQQRIVARLSPGLTELIERKAPKAPVEKALGTKRGMERGPLSGPNVGAQFQARVQDDVVKGSLTVNEALQLKYHMGPRGTRLQALSEEAAAAKEELRKFKWEPGKAYTLDTQRVGEVVKTLDGHLDAVEKEIADIANREGIVGRGASQNYRTAHTAMLMTEWESMLELRRGLPTRKTLLKTAVMQAKRDLAHEVTSIAEKKNLKQFLNTIVGRVIGKGRDLEEASPKQLANIKEALTRVEPNYSGTRFVQPPAVSEEFAQAVISDKFQVTHPVTGEKVAFSKLAIPRNLAREIATTVNPREPGSLDKVAGAIHSLLSPFKRWVTGSFFGIPRPGFHVRNILDNSVRGGMSFGWRFYNPFSLRHAWNVMAGKDGEVEINGVKVTYDWIRDQLREHGMWRSAGEFYGMEPKGIRGMIDQISDGKYVSYRQARTRLGEAIAEGAPEIAKKFSPVLSAGKVGSGVDNLSIVQGFLTQLKAGIPVDQIGADLRRTFFAYQQLTDFERMWMRAAIPFYGYMRQALPLVAWQMAKRPWVFTGGFPRVQDFRPFLDVEKAEIPDWVRDYPLLNISHEGKGKFKILSLRNVFTIDMLPNVIPTLTPEKMRGWFTQLNPILLYPLQWAMGRDIYFGSDLNQPKLLTRDLQSKFLRESPIIKDFLQAREVTKQVGRTKRTFLAVNARAWLALRSLWFSRLWKDVDALAATFEGEVGAEALSGFLTGFKLMEVDGYRQLHLLAAEADQAYSDYRKALRQGDAVKASEILDAYQLR